MYELEVLNRFYFVKYDISILFRKNFLQLCAQWRNFVGRNRKPYLIGRWRRKRLYLTEAVFKWKGFDAECFHALNHFFIKILHFIHWDETIAIQIHTTKPILNAAKIKILTSHFKGQDSQLSTGNGAFFYFALGHTHYILRLTDHDMGCLGLMGRKK